MTRYFNSEAVEMIGRPLGKAHDAQPDELAIAIVDDGRWRTASDDVKGLYVMYAAGALIISYDLYAVPIEKLALCVERGCESSSISDPSFTVWQPRDCMASANRKSAHNLNELDYGVSPQWAAAYDLGKKNGLACKGSEACPYPSGTNAASAYWYGYTEGRVKPKWETTNDLVRH